MTSPGRALNPDGVGAGPSGLGANSSDAGGAESHAQRDARRFVVALHGAVRAVRLYPVENAAVQKAIHELGAATDFMIRLEGECSFRRVGDYLFLNDARLRLTLDNYAAVTYVLALLRDAGIGGVRVAASADSRAWVVLLALLQSPPLEYPESERRIQLGERLLQAGVLSFELVAPTDDHEAVEAEIDNRERARRTYMRSLDVARDVISAARIGRSPGLKRVKRAVQGIVDAILTDPSSMLGLTTLREFDDYTFVHSVNVCILSVALGRRIDLSRTQLLDLGLAALMHDIGKSRLALEVLNKRGALDDAGEPAPLQLLREFLAIAGSPVGEGPLPDQVVAGVNRAHGGRLPTEARPDLDAIRDSGLPVLVASGDHTPGLEAICDALAERLDAERIVCPGAGHFVTAAPGFSDRLEEFLCQISTGPRDR